MKVDVHGGPPDLVDLVWVRVLWDEWVGAEVEMAGSEFPGNGGMSVHSYLLFFCAIFWPLSHRFYSDSIQRSITRGSYMDPFTSLQIEGVLEDRRPSPLAIGRYFSALVVGLVTAQWNIFSVWCSVCMLGTFSTIVLISRPSFLRTITQFHWIHALALSFQQLILWNWSCSRSDQGPQSKYQFHNRST